MVRGESVFRDWISNFMNIALETATCRTVHAPAGRRIAQGNGRAAWMVWNRPFTAARKWQFASMSPRTRQKTGVPEQLQVIGNRWQWWAWPGLNRRPLRCQEGGQIRRPLKEKGKGVPAWSENGVFRGSCTPIAPQHGENWKPCHKMRWAIPADYLRRENIHSIAQIRMRDSDLTP